MDLDDLLGPRPWHRIGEERRPGDRRTDVATPSDVRAWVEHQLAELGDTTRIRVHVDFDLTKGKIWVGFYRASDDSPIRTTEELVAELGFDVAPLRQIGVSIRRVVT